MKCAGAAHDRRQIARTQGGGLPGAALTGIVCDIPLEATLDI